MKERNKKKKKKKKRKEQAEKPEIELSTSAETSKRQESSRKPFISALLAIPKPLTMWIRTNCGTF